MSHPDEFPDSAVVGEQLRSLYHSQFERLFIERSELAQFADQRGEALPLLLPILQKQAPIIRPYLH